MQLPDTVTVLVNTPGAADVYGNATSSWADGQTIRGWLQPTGTSEDVRNQDVVVSDWLLFTSPDAPITPLSRVRDAAGHVFEVVGLPAVHKTPRGPHHVEAKLRFVQG